MEGDAAVSVFSTWAIAHGHLACAYQLGSGKGLPSLVQPYTLIPPLYPLFTGVLAALFRIGHSVPYPTPAQLGPHCSTAVHAMYQWALASHVILPTIRLAYFSWLVLLAGVVALLRASGRGRCRWEPVTLVLIACAPPTFTCLTEYFHPQDIVAMGLILIGLARVRQSKWVWAGVFLGLAFTTQQFALLVLAPILIVAPRSQRLKFLAGAAGAAAVVVSPFIILTSGKAFRATVIGSGFTKSFGGTVLWETHPQGALLFLLSRILPAVLAIGLAVWAVQRLGPRILEPVPLISLIATAFSFRLVLEENLFGYYFMAVAVMLIVLDVVNHRFRRYLVAWFLLDMLAFNPVPWGFASNGQAWGLTARLLLPIFIAIIALLFLVVDAARRRFRADMLAWLFIVGLILTKIEWTAVPLRHTVPTWFWQIALVPTALALAVGPLVSAVRSHLDSELPLSSTRFDETVERMSNE